MQGQQPMDQPRLAFALAFPGEEVGTLLGFTAEVEEAVDLSPPLDIV